MEFQGKGNVKGKVSVAGMIFTHLRQNKQHDQGGEWQDLRSRTEAGTRPQRARAQSWASSESNRKTLKSLRGRRRS